MNEPLASGLVDLKLIVFDFDGVFTDNTVQVNQHGVESVNCWRGDGIGLSQLRELGLDMMILSTETNPVVSARAKKLKIECIHGCDDKLSRLKQLIADKGCTETEVAFMGNDVNDAQCLAYVGVPIVVADCHQSVRNLGRYVTRARGGRGAVREVCDLIVAVKSEQSIG